MHGVNIKAADNVAAIVKQAYMTGASKTPSYEDYEFYKALLPVDLSCTEYEQVCRMIADALGI